MVRRAAGEVAESRDADSTLEGENIGARRPGKRELGGKKDPDGNGILQSGV